MSDGRYHKPDCESPTCFRCLPPVAVLNDPAYIALKAENEALKKERDEAIGKYHAEIHEGRKRCEGIVSIAEDASFRLGKAEGLENAVSILNGCEEAGRTARLEIEHRLREMKSWSPE